MRMIFMANKSLASCRRSPGERGGWKTTNYDVYNRQFCVASLNRLSRHPLSVFDYVINKWSPFNFQCLPSILPQHTATPTLYYSVNEQNPPHSLYASREEKIRTESFPPSPHRIVLSSMVHCVSFANYLEYNIM